VPEAVVVDASAIVDVLAGTTYAMPVTQRLRDTLWHAPAHLDAEVLSALGRLARAGRLQDVDVEARLALLASMPVRRRLLPSLLPGAWARRAGLRLLDALYVELAHQLDAPLVTTDRRLARSTPLAEVITAPPA
jgi:predicted nucleic acid-binding protein